MKNLKWWIIGIILILAFPVIPYEEKTESVVEINYKCIAVYLFDRYEKVQLENVEDQLEEKSEKQQKAAP